MLQLTSSKSLFRSSMYCILLSALGGLFFSSVAHSVPLKVGISPTLPEPLGKLDDEQKPVDQKQLKILEPTPRKNPQTKDSYHDAPTKLEVWREILNIATRETGLEFELEEAKSQLNFELKLAQGAYDLSYMNPIQFIAAKKAAGYKAVVKRKSQPMRGMIFVRKSGEHHSLKSLKGKTIALPGLLNFASSIVLRESLQNLQVRIIPEFLASESEVYKAVAAGKFVAGGGTQESLLGQPSEIQNSLKVVWDSPGFTPPAFAAHPRVPFYSIIRLQRTMVSLVKSEEGKELLEHIFVNNGFEVARDSDWHDVEKIDLDKLNEASARMKAGQ